MNMKNLVCIAMLLALLVSCGQKTAEPSGYARFEKRVAELSNAGTIAEKADLLYLYARQEEVDADDADLYAEDPHAYWLYDCMTTLHSYLQTPEDRWAYHLVMDSCVSIYNNRLGRKSGSLSLALKAVSELLSGYTAGNQPQMNGWAYFKQLTNELHTLRLYKSIDDYMTDDLQKGTLDGGYAQEFKAWQQVVDACERIMYEYTFSQARYSAAPMEMSFIKESWYADRLEILDKEWNCIVLAVTDSVAVKEEPTTDADLAFIINRFYNNVPTAGWDDVSFGWYDDDAQELAPYLSDPEVQDHVRVLAYHCKQAVKRWQAVREQVLQSLPQDRQEQYRLLTQAMQDRIYAMLVSLDHMYS